MQEETVNNGPVIPVDAETTENKLKKPVSPHKNHEYDGKFAKGNNLGKGNKGARWLSTRLNEAINKVVDGDSEPIYMRLIQKVIDKAIIDGDMKALEMIWNRMEGKAPQNIDITAVVAATPLTGEQKEKLKRLLEPIK